MLAGAEADDVHQAAEGKGRNGGHGPQRSARCMVQLLCLCLWQFGGQAGFSSFGFGVSASFGVNLKP